MNAWTNVLEASADSEQKTKLPQLMIARPAECGDVSSKRHLTINHDSKISCSFSDPHMYSQYEDVVNIDLLELLARTQPHT